MYSASECPIEPTTDVLSNIKYMQCNVAKLVCNILLQNVYHRVIQKQPAFSEKPERKTPSNNNKKSPVTTVKCIYPFQKCMPYPKNCHLVVVCDYQLRCVSGVQVMYISRSIHRLGFWQMQHHSSTGQNQIK